MEEWQLRRIREGIKKNPLYRESRKIGLEYDRGDPFFDLAYYMVNGCGVKNIVLKSTYGGLCLEATAKTIVRSDGINLPKVMKRFDPDAEIYPLNPPFFVEISQFLSGHIYEGINNNGLVTIERDVLSPFKGVHIQDDK